MYFQAVILIDILSAALSSAAMSIQFVRRTGENGNVFMNVGPQWSLGLLILGQDWRRHRRLEQRAGHRPCSLVGHVKSTSWRGMRCLELPFQDRTFLEPRSTFHANHSAQLQDSIIACSLVDQDEHLLGKAQGLGKHTPQPAS